MDSELKQVTIYTDGACSGNPGPGGYGVVLLYGKHRKELSGGVRLTTNNRMEITAAIEGLASLKKNCKVDLYTDSKYLADAITKGWAKKWRGNGWKRNKKEMAINPDLWEKLLALCERHEVDFIWIKGHADNLENERCDSLCTQAAKGKDLPPDTVYENSLEKSRDNLF